MFQKSKSKLDGSDLVELSEQVAFLVLKREWQKCGFEISINFFPKENLKFQDQVRCAKVSCPNRIK